MPLRAAWPWGHRSTEPVLQCPPTSSARLAAAISSVLLEMGQVAQGSQTGAKLEPLPQLCPQCSLPLGYPRRCSPHWAAAPSTPQGSWPLLTHHLLLCHPTCLHSLKLPGTFLSLVKNENQINNPPPPLSRAEGNFPRCVCNKRASNEHSYPGSDGTAGAGNCRVCSTGCALSLWSCNRGSEDMRKHEGRKNNFNEEGLDFTGDTDSASRALLPLTLSICESLSPSSKQGTALPCVTRTGGEQINPPSTEPQTTLIRKVLSPSSTRTLGTQCEQTQESYGWEHQLPSECSGPALPGQPSYNHHQNQD